MINSHSQNFPWFCLQLKFKTYVLLTTYCLLASIYKLMLGNRIRPETESPLVDWLNIHTPLYTKSLLLLVATKDDWYSLSTDRLDIVKLIAINYFVSLINQKIFSIFPKKSQLHSPQSDNLTVF